MFKLQIEPWDQIQNVEITTVHAAIRLKEEGEYVEYEHREYGHWESVEYKLRIKKKEGYKQYLRELVELDVEVPDLKNLVGIMSHFRDLYKQAMSLLRRGIFADIMLKWWDKDILVEFGLYASKGGNMWEVQSVVKAQRGGECLALRYAEYSEDAEGRLERHTRNAVGLYLLFKEYVLGADEVDKT